MGELGNLLGQLPPLLVMSLCACVAAWRPSRSPLRFAKGGRGGFKVYVAINFTSLGPQNYETNFLISVADQLLKIRRVFLLESGVEGFVLVLHFAKCFPFWFPESWLFFLLLCTDSSVCIFYLMEQDWSF